MASERQKQDARGTKFNGKSDGLSWEALREQVLSWLSMKFDEPFGNMLWNETFPPLNDLDLMQED